MLVTAFLGGPDQLMEGLGTFVGGMGCYAGVRLGMKLCAHKMMKEEA